MSGQVCGARERAPRLRVTGVIAICAALGFVLAACSSNDLAQVGKTTGSDASPVSEEIIADAGVEVESDDNGSGENDPGSIEATGIDVRLEAPGGAEGDAAPLLEGAENAPPAAPGASASFATLNMELVSEVPLERIAYTASPINKYSLCHDKADRPPYQVEADKVYGFCIKQIESLTANVDVTYRVLGDHTVNVWVKGVVPHWGWNTLECEIRDPRTNEPSRNTTLTCEVAWLEDGGTGLDPHPKVKIRNAI